MTDPLKTELPEPSAWRVAESYWTKRASIPGGLLMATNPEPLYTASQMHSHAAACVEAERGQALSDDSLLAAVMAYIGAGKQGANLDAAIKAAVAAAIRKAPK